ncbi:hypothetical protein R5W23_002868 [Gemmata sp. JC673]|uniref:DUF1573 domain-containing protein n=1 Tax=Gemmata algarum TaxID=2975278 RepID=A0ABU5F2M3_9BACT|nr:hypothetical protein [Gemmata algarum]MDY3561590.1 hypothetical protein [Gemmata algarum]
MISHAKWAVVAKWALLTGLLAGGGYAGVAGVLQVAGKRTPAGLSVTPPEFDLGEHKAGHVAKVSVQLVNDSPAPARVLGVYKDCTCLMVDAPFPVEIPAGGVITIPVEVAFPAPPGPFVSKLAFFTDEQHIRQLRVKLAGATSRG